MVNHDPCRCTCWAGHVTVRTVQSFIDEPTCTEPIEADDLIPDQPCGEPIVEAEYGIEEEA